MYFPLQAYTAAMATNIERVLLHPTTSGDYEIQVTCLLTLTGDDGHAISDNGISAAPGEKCQRVVSIQSSCCLANRTVGRSVF